MSRRSTVRHLVHAEIARRLTANTDLTGVTVQDGRTTRDKKRETIVVGENTRTIETDMPYMQGGRKQRVDKFAFDVEFEALVRQKDPSVAKARAAEMFSVLDDALAEDPTLGGLIISAVITSIDGPSSEDLSPDGFGGYLTATVSIHSQLN